MIAEQRAVWSGIPQNKSYYRYDNFVSSFKATSRLVREVLSGTRLG